MLPLSFYEYDALVFIAIKNSAVLHKIIRWRLKIINDSLLVVYVIVQLFSISKKYLHIR